VEHVDTGTAQHAEHRLQFFGAVHDLGFEVDLLPLRQPEGDWEIGATASRTAATTSAGNRTRAKIESPP